MADLIELEEKLSTLSHSEAALDEIRRFSEALGNSSRRIAVLNADRALVRPPICMEETTSLGFDRPDDAFTLLQGDLVTTEAAYFLGERVTNSPKYVALNSSCDLVPHRREYAALLRGAEIRRSEPDAKAKLSLLLRFSRRDSMYLPALPCDDPAVVCNAIRFDGICQIRSNDLLLAHRLASLSLVGWRMFGCFSRVVIARAGDREGPMRRAVERQPVQGTLYPP